jgi:hypothetical protein
MSCEQRRDFVTHMSRKGLHTYENGLNEDAMSILSESKSSTNKARSRLPSGGLQKHKKIAVLKVQRTLSASSKLSLKEYNTSERDPQNAKRKSIIKHGSISNAELKQF